MKKIKIMMIGSILAFSIVWCTSCGMSEVLTSSIVGFITGIKGNPMIDHGGEQVLIQLGAPVYLNDAIQTNKKGKVEIVFLDKSILYIGPVSKVSITRYFYDPKTHISQTEVSLLQGKIRNKVRRLQQENSRYEVKTKTALCGVIGTDFAMKTFDGEKGSIFCFDGTIWVKRFAAPADEKILKADQQMDFSHKLLASVKKLSAVRIKETIQEITIASDEGEHLFDTAAVCSDPERSVLDAVNQEAVRLATMKTDSITKLRDTKVSLVEIPAQPFFGARDKEEEKK